MAQDDGCSDDCGGEMGNDEHACFDIGWYLDVGIDGKSCTGCWYV